MLNELSQVVTSLDAIGIAGASRHQNVQPMGKNADIFVVSVGQDGRPQSVEVVRAEVGQHLLKFAPANNGPGFPGFNLPTPLRTLDSTSSEELTPAIEGLLALAKSKSAPTAALSEAVLRLFALSTPRTFTESQAKQFQRSCGDLVTQLREKLSTAPSELANFNKLLCIVDAAKLSLPAFAESLAQRLTSGGSEHDRYALLRFQHALFGTLDWKKRFFPQICGFDWRDCIAA